MRSSSLLAITFALYGAVLAAPPATSPTTTQAPAPNAVESAHAGNTPDCTSIEHYCKTCSSDDFNCETDPNCEWCRAHSAWYTSSSTSSTSPSSSSPTTMTTTTSTSASSSGK
ncbi:uncharacterized protein F4807DRAFT_278944 [Annulohypoxylon truncatum]|uniref:uncharacterized protein n=1 Tax=Annulohypoxylon truncatum TaxID=327061 RepID=UPI002008CCBB|nr:uncharacterized protein F4807DRAFT_278944 [Annulohypoxylon truncatum]KAI1205666.1 hypothetical protein F4807DRAFT_278944 [Annulohypoxylon truncatum]